MTLVTPTRAAFEVQRLTTRPTRHRTGTERYCSHRFAGEVRSAACDGEPAQLGLEAGTFLVTAAITRDSVEELALAAGVSATVDKATSVMIERGASERQSIAGECRPLPDEATASVHELSAPASA